MLPRNTISCLLFILSNRNLLLINHGQLPPEELKLLLSTAHVWDNPPNEMLSCCA